MTLAVAPSIDLVAARALYPVTERYTWLNHAAHSPLSTRVAGAMEAYVIEHRDTGLLDFDAWIKRRDDARRDAATLLNATPADVAFVKNTSAGLLLVANGLDWRAGDNVVTAEREFPSNVHPWLNLRARGVETRFAPCRDGRVLIDDIAALMDDRTRVLAISYVGFSTGYRHDLAALADLAHARGAYLVVDGVQGLGVMPLDVTAMGVDFLSAAGHKWLMASYGAGIFYVRPGLLDVLSTQWTSWLSHSESEDMDRYDQPLWNDARRFEEGVFNLAGILGLGESIATLLEYGIPNIQRHVFTLNTAFMEELAGRGYEIVSPHATEAERSGIVIFRHPTLAAADLVARLQAADVIVSARGGGVRVAPHFYNSWADMERLLAALP